MPHAGEAVKLMVDGYHEAQSMRWHRSFDGHKVHSNLQQQGEFLIEHLGPLKLWLKLKVADHGLLQYQLKRVSLWGVRIPKWLAPWLGCLRIGSIWRL